MEGSTWELEEKFFVCLFVFIFGKSNRYFNMTISREACKGRVERQGCERTLGAMLDAGPNLEDRGSLCNMGVPYHVCAAKALGGLRQ